MTKLTTLCIALLLITASHSDGKIPVTMDGTYSSPGESLQEDQTSNNHPQESLLNQGKNRQSGESRQDRTNKSWPVSISWSPWNQHHTSQLSKSLQRQAHTTGQDKGATSPPDQKNNSTRSNIVSLLTRPKTGQNSLFSHYTRSKRLDDVTNYESSKDKSYGSFKSSQKGGYHTDYAITLHTGQPVDVLYNHIDHLSSKQVPGQPVLVILQKPIYPSSTVPHKPDPAGEGEIWSRDHSFYNVDLAACGSTKLYDIVIPLDENVNMEVQRRALGTDKAIQTDSESAENVDIACKFRVIAKDPMYLSGTLNWLDLRGGVQGWMNMTIAGGKKTYHLYQSVGSDFTNNFVFPSLSSELVFTFQLSGGRHMVEAESGDLIDASVSFFFILTPQSGFQLEHRKVTSTAGYIKSFAFGIKIYRRYPHDTDCMVHILVTGAVISFPHFDLQDSPECQADRLTLSRLQYTTQGTTEYTKIWSQCGIRYILPQVYDHHLTLHFVSDSSHSRTGFKMLYSTHPGSQLPQKLDSGLYNCSVPHYPDFRRHFHCNLEWECAAGEDEADCPYTSTDCGSDHIHIGKKCYLYLPVRRKMTWYDASELCQRQQRRLVIVKNEGDWDSFVAVHTRQKTSPALLSFAMPSADTESLFGSELHLPDESLVQRPGVNDSDSSPYCAYSPALVQQDRPTITTIPCNSSLYIHFILCEQENTTNHRPLILLENQIQEKAQWWTVSSSSVHANLTACSISMAKNSRVIYHISVEDGMTFEARGVPSSDFFYCSINLMGRRGHYIATVIEKFEVDMDPAMAENEIYTALQIATVVTRESTETLYYWPNYRESDFKHAFVVVCNESSIAFNLQSEGGARSIYLRLRVIVTAQSGTSHLSHLSVPPQGSILTSFAFDGQTRYAHDTNAIYVLNANGVMNSFRHFDLEYNLGCQSDKLAFDVYTDILKFLNYYHLVSKCGREDIPPIYKTKLRIRFITGSSQAATGFQMLYSLHLLSQLPQEPRLGLFNCSVPQYLDFRLHFHCNLERECVAGEDETDCPYTSKDCGSGYIDAGNKCYLYLPVRREMTWYNASKLCRRHGERLVSPQTPSEWSTFRTVTDYGKKTFGVFVGLSTSSPSLKAMYREVWQWEDQTMAFYLNACGQELSKPTCAYLPPIFRDMLEPIRCEDKTYIHYVLCEKDKAQVNVSHMQVRLSNLPNTVWPDSFFHCTQRHVTHSFLSCDFHAQCGVTQHMSSCSMSEGESVPLFECDSVSWTVHYSLVCDHRQDCPDGSDEKWCQHAPCATSQFMCKNQQCVPQKDWCDGMRHCVDGSDEDCLQSVHTVVPSLPPPAVILFNGHGGYDIRTVDAIQQCPVTHFRCSSLGYCLPVYLRCNDVLDCPGHEDEEQCDSYTCPGFYHCRASSICVHSQHVCDGLFQCPQQDDEWLCDVICPKGCRCQGLAFTCSQTFPAYKFHSLRYLDARGSRMRPRDLPQNHYLVRLSLAQCGLTSVDNMTFPNLRWLDLSANTLTTINIQTFASLTNLRVLRLAQNPLTSLVSSRVDAQHPNLHTLDLSLTELLTYHGQSLTGFPFLTHLNISHGSLTTIGEQGLNSTPQLQVLDVRGSPLDSFPPHLLRDLVFIYTVYADNFKLCCPATLPYDFNPNKCHAPVDELASCDDLLRSNAYRISLWFMAVMALVGNAVSFVYRVLRREATNTDFHVFVSNLCLADFLMGLYLAVIGAADAVYRGEYLWNDKLWKGSATCQMAGLLSLLSSEMSAFFICLITLDRFIVLRFPFSQVRFHTRSALAASALAWTGGCLLALVPLLPMTSHWRFYSQTGICIPLPITRATFKGRGYSFGVMVVFNFVLFTVIALGQLLVFLSVRKNSMTGSRGEQDAIIARRLTTIVLSDFLCWFPIGLLGLLASTGTPISSELNVGMAIFVLPFNSALNPFLYTFNVLMEKRRKAAEARLLETLKRQAGSH